MRDRTSNYSTFLALAALVPIAILLDRYFVAYALGATVLVHLLYSLFYTKRPRQYPLFMAAGVCLASVNILTKTPILVHLFLAVVTIEGARVLIVSLLKYPRTIKELQALTTELEHRVAQRTAELEKANEKLRELDKMKSAFVSQASHDLRTPLTAIKSSLDNVMRGVGGVPNEKHRQLLGRALGGVNRLTDLINDVLDISRIESGRIVLETSKVRFEVLVQAVVNENQPAAYEKRIVLGEEALDDSYPVQVDAGKMERVVGELVSNAIKYTPEGGRVEVILRKEANQVVLSVRDSGIGMRPEECKKVFDRFYRTPASQSVAKGSGLGLSIAKELIEMHGGNITAESEPGKGTTFTMTLPRKSS